jgi:hypothetical protein
MSIVQHHLSSNSHYTQNKPGTFLSPFFCGPQQRRIVKTKEGTPDRKKKSIFPDACSMVKTLRYPRIGKPSMYFMYLLYVNLYEVPQIGIRIYDVYYTNYLIQEIIFLFQENPLYLLYEQTETTRSD